MVITKSVYIKLVVFHVIFGILAYAMPFITKPYSFLILLIGCYYVVKHQNNNNEVLLVTAYVVGSEAFLRMTGGNPTYEFSKYAVIFFIFLGMYYKGFSKNAIPYWIFLILLVPGIIIATQTFSLDYPTVRQSIFFNISGPVCLGLCSLYCYNRKVTIQDVNTILLFVGLPIISCTVYVILYTPDLKEALVNTMSNFATSGGFGPNQVSTVLGLGMFVFFSRLIFESKTIFLFCVNSILFVVIGYRCLLTFSRGGFITGVSMVVILAVFVYLFSHDKVKLKLLYFFGLLIFTSAVAWLYVNVQTGGLIEKRYQNKDALGRQKKDKFAGRGELAEGELVMFTENPFFGVGAGRGTDIRNDGKSTDTSTYVASHNEVTRMLAEHGSLGILALLILFFTPIILLLDNKQHIYCLCFILFWFLTINHAAMRTAAPAFIYSLSVLKVRFKEENEITIHRE